MCERDCLIARQDELGEGAEAAQSAQFISYILLPADKGGVVRATLITMRCTYPAAKKQLRQSGQLQPNTDKQTER